jgi:hypothetical protein
MLRATSMDSATMYKLSDEQVAKYREDGYLVVRHSEHNLFDPAELQKWSAEVQGWPKVEGKWMPYDEINTKGERMLLRTEYYVDYHPQFYDLLCGDALLRPLVSQVAGSVSTFLS